MSATALSMWYLPYLTLPFDVVFTLPYLSMWYLPYLTLRYGIYLTLPYLSMWYLPYLTYSPTYKRLESSLNTSLKVYMMMAKRDTFK